METLTTVDVPIDKIDSNPRQPRFEFGAEEMALLVTSVKEYGILQPLMVSASHDGKYSLIAGERRLRAAKEAGLERVPAVIVVDATERDQLELALIENVQRVDLNPLEKARAYQQLADEFNLSHEEIAAKVGVSRSTVTNALRLLKLPEDIEKAILAGTLSERQAGALLTLFELPESMRKAAERGYYARPSGIVKQALGGLSSDGIRDAIEGLVRNYAKELQKAAWDLDYVFVTSEAIHWPECRTCDLRHKPLNVCTNPSCYDAKERAWKYDYLRQASAGCGILPLESDYAYYEVTHLSYRSSAQSILGSGCENLRLAYDEHEHSGPFTLEAKGYPKAVIVCMKKNGHCNCLKGMEILEAQKRREAVQAIQNTPMPGPGAETTRVDEDVLEADAEEEIADEAGWEETEEVQPDASQEWQQRPQRPSPEELAEVVKQQRKRDREQASLAKEATEQAVKIIHEAMEADEPGAWSLIYNRVAQGERWDKRPDDPVEIRKGIAEKIVNHRISYLEPKQVPDTLKSMLIEAGLQTPKF